VLFASVSSVLLGAAELPLRVWLGGSLIVAAAGWQALQRARAGPLAPIRNSPMPPSV
jgi:hypothetical protein